MVKRILVRMAGLVTALVAAAGVVFSGLAVQQTWLAADQLSRDVPVVLEHLEAVVNSVHGQAEATVSLLDTALDRMQLIRDAAEELASRSSQRATTATLLETLEEDIGQRLEIAEQFVVSMQASLRSTSQALLVLDSLPFVSTRLAPSGSQREGQLSSVATSLVGVADLLEQVTTTITRIRSEQALAPGQLEQVRSTLDRVDRELHAVQREISAFSQRVDDTGAQLESLQASIPQWIAGCAVAVTIFLVCFGFSQLSLLLHAFQLLDRPGPHAV